MSRFFREVAGEIVLRMNDEKWPVTEAKIEKALIEAYNLGAQTLLERLKAEAEKESGSP